ncbi:MAG TPA: 3-dehydroquinate synthase [Bryobacteraceae bacterium]|jgi:3-dehydroquinate synthase|nr:3-dehydroquinate synthase [Bryobacteraceae bacterium]
MPSWLVQTANSTYEATIARGCLGRIAEALPASAGTLFVVTEERVWNLHGPAVRDALGSRQHQVLFFPGGEVNKRLAAVEDLAEQMLARGADRSSVVIALGGGIVNDVAGFAAAVFMRGIPVIQVPTTLLAQVDAAVGGKTGVNLRSGKNLVGSFHQPLAVFIDPQVLATLPEREYRAGLYEIVKCGVIRDAALFRLMAERPADILAHHAEALERAISDSVRIKAEVVSADEREGGLRRILNFGHTFGHALEAETGYERFLHGEAVAFGMNAAVSLAVSQRILRESEGRRILDCVAAYGPIPSLSGIDPLHIARRLVSDKKTVKGRVHFVLPDRIGSVVVTADVDQGNVLRAIEAALAQ